MLTLLSELFQRELPGELAHQEFLPMRGSSKAAIANGAPHKKAAVAIVLFINQSGKLATIVTQRQVYEGNHSGQISFPGGKYEEQDRALVQTAIRECKEEIGIDCGSFIHLGELSQVYIPVSEFLIHPHVFFSNNKVFEYQPNEREVALIQELDLHELFHPSSRSLEDVFISQHQQLKNIPHFNQGNMKIWGATALLLNELKWLVYEELIKNGNEQIQ